MAQLDRLMRDARKAMRQRGHNPVTDWKESGRGMLHCCNEGCNQGVIIVVMPQPNETQISGTAVALNCSVATNVKQASLTIRGDEISMEAVMGC